MAETASKRRGLPYVLAAVGVLCAIAIGALAYANERGTREVTSEVGAEQVGDGVHLEFGAQRIEAQRREVVTQLRVVPWGALATDQDQTIPAKNIVVELPLATTTRMELPAGDRIAVKEVRLPLSDGVISDYPFDRYTVQLLAEVTVDGADIPMSLSYTDYDPFYLSRVTEEQVDAGVAYAEIKVKRSRGTFILAWFQLLVMWLLSLSVLAGALYIVRHRLGLPWPALGWMAATLFALVGFRNAAPGTPPVGSLIDYCAFFWAEAIVAFSIALVTWKGVRVTG
ncbi:DUF4436 family protein [Nocardia sp. NPDC005978]|uniref:DUF4436 family protein n=1 Tax=Nocardia sp. NPDC005978 TaxID=3156725 RepID=UPI0033A6C125